MEDLYRIKHIFAHNILNIRAMFEKKFLKTEKTYHLAPFNMLQYNALDGMVQSKNFFQIENQSQMYVGGPT